MCSEVTSNIRKLTVTSINRRFFVHSVKFERKTNVGKIRKAWERTGKHWKEPENFFGPNFPVLSNPPVPGQQKIKEIKKAEYD